MHARFDIDRHPGRVVVVAQGEIDIATVPLWEERIAQAEASNAAQILIDLREVSFMDASGLKVLLRAHARSQANGDRLRLSEAPPQVRRLFELAGIRATLPFVSPTGR